MRPLFALLLLAAATCACAQPAASKPIEIKVVVLSMFEQGADTGDVPGEYQYWVEREHLDTILPFPQASKYCWLTTFHKERLRGNRT